MNIFNNKKSGFTLAELLLTLIIVGIIAAVVMPTLITRAQNRMFETAYQREIADLTDTFEALAVNEGVYRLEEVDSVKSCSTSKTNLINCRAQISGFLKKYLNVARLCEDIDIDSDSASQCFAETYKDISEGKEYNFGHYMRAQNTSCALLKNGMSICLSPLLKTLGGKRKNPNQRRGMYLHIDVNGPKGPNIINRDYRDMTIIFDRADGSDKLLYICNAWDNSTPDACTTPY